MKDITIENNYSIKFAIEKLNKTQEQCLLVVNKKNIFLGTLTDGDIRRAILKGKDFKENINDTYNKKPLILSNKATIKEKNAIFKKYPLSHLKVFGVMGGWGGGGTARPAAQSEAGPIAGQAGPKAGPSWAGVRQALGPKNI